MTRSANSSGGGEPFTCAGKQVLANGFHYCDAVSEDAAENACAALNERAARRRASTPTALPGAEDVALREAADDAVATLMAVRAAASDLDEWRGAADHFSDLCAREIRKLNAILRSIPRASDEVPSGQEQSS